MTDEPEEEPSLRRLTLSRRVALLERDSRSHARSLTEIVKVVGAHSDEIKELGDWKMGRLLAEVREEEREKALLSRLDQIDASIKNMREVWTRILWIAAGVIVPAAIVGLALVLVYGVNLLRPAGGA